MRGFLFGKEELRADISDGARLLNMFMEYGIVYSDFGETGDGKVSFCVSPFSAAAVVTLCEKKKIDIRTKKMCNNEIDFTKMVDNRIYM